MPTIIFSNTKKREQEYLSQLFEEKEWFKREHFPVFLPPAKASNRQKIKELSRKEIDQLNKDWKRIERDFFATIKTFRHKKLVPKYVGHVSRFGPEGKYQSPNIVFIRLRAKHDARQATETIAHELIHLFFADFFESKKLNYAECEGMVDALVLESGLADIFPNYKRQSVGKVRRKLLKSILMLG